jgi:hypothetical protein
VSARCRGSNCSPATGTDQATPIVRWMGSYGLVQAERLNRSPAATTYEVIRGIVISQSPSASSPPGRAVVMNELRKERHAVDLPSKGMRIM